MTFGAKFWEGWSLRCVAGLLGVLVWTSSGAAQTNGECETAAVCPATDVNCDDIADGFDIAEIRSTANWLRTAVGAANPRADVNGDGFVDGFDVAAVRNSACWLVPPDEVPTETAVYELTFDAAWSAATHPQDFPPNPHFSGLVGGTHGDTVFFWEVGGLATPGIKSMAETGSKTLLIGEVEDAIDAGDAEFVISGPGVGLSPGIAAVSFVVSQEYSLATVVTMIAPSPDWFVGVNGLDLFEDGRWAEEVTVVLYPYDAGTDSGATYTSPNQPTVPRDLISEIMGFPFLDGGVVNPLGTFTFRRID